jgi:hypothetical protein
MSANMEFSEPTQAEKDELQNWLKAKDPNQTGVDMSKFRELYPKLNWTVIQWRTDALVSDGKLTMRVRRGPGAKVGIAYYTWQ